MPFSFVVAKTIFMRKPCWVHDSKTVDEGAGSKSKARCGEYKK
jgi:hypothetical protein